MSTYPAPAPGKVRCPALPPALTGVLPPPHPERGPGRRRSTILKWGRVCWRQFKWVSLVRTDLRDLSEENPSLPWVSEKHSDETALRILRLGLPLKTTLTYKSCQDIFLHDHSDQTNQDMNTVDHHTKR